MKVAICGGGNIAHSLIAAFSEHDDVCVYSIDKWAWAKRLSCEIGPNRTPHVCKNEIVAPATLEHVSEAELVIIPLPRFAIENMLSLIDGVLHRGQTLVFIPSPAGLEPIVEKYVARGLDVVGFQRVPYVARVKESGKLVWIADVRKVTKAAFSRPEISEEWCSFFESRFTGGRIEPLKSFLSLTFSNSNPLLHPSRLVALLHGGREGAYEKCPFFYAEWTDESSEYYVKADAEMYAAFRAYSEEAAAADYESALAHYESTTPYEMTRKMISIESLKPILAPWKHCEDGLWYPDYTSRYFTEDVPFGTCIIQKYARQVGVPTPMIDMFVDVITRRVNNKL